MTRYLGRIPRKLGLKVFESIVLRLIGTITHFSTSDPLVALTFDDGPNSEFTPRILHILSKHKAHATFFMLGKHAQRHQELVKRVWHAGHAIGNHSWDHPSFPSITGRERRAQIRACERVIAPYGQRLFRSPYGDQSLASRLDAFWLGYQVVAWSVVAEDWLYHSTDWMVQRLVSGIRPGSVVLLHDALFTADVKKCSFSREPMLDSLSILIEQLSGRFRFVTIPELFKHGRPQKRIWYQLNRGAKENGG